MVSLDEMFQFIERLENDPELEKICSQDDLERVNQFISLLAAKGALKAGGEEMLALKGDIQDLLQKDYLIAFINSFPFLNKGSVFFSH